MQHALCTAAVAAAAAVAADADQATQLQHMREIAEVRRMQGGVTPELLQQALQQSRLRRARRLFQPLPYLQQEQADVTSTDVAAIVEILCGKPSPATPSAITGTVGLEDPAVYWQQRPAQILQAGSTQQQQQQQVLHSDSIGQIASCILIKLIVDLWLSAGGAVAFPLVLRMLQQALYQQQPEHRVNAFNIVYSLALHGCMLMPPQRSQPSSPVAQPVRRDAAAAAAAAQAGTSSLLQQQLQQLSLLQQQHREQQQQHPTAAEIAVGQQDPESDSPGAAGLDLNPGHHQGQGSPRSQGGSSAHSHSPLSSPRIHLPPQLLSPTSQQQQQQGFSSLTQQQQQQQFGGSTSPLPSPTGRSRLSRSELRIHAEQLRRSNEHQEHKPSPAAAAAASDDRAAGDDGGEGGSEGQFGSGSSSSSEGLPPVELAWEAWLQQLLYELLLMLSMVSTYTTRIFLLQDLLPSLVDVLDAVYIDLLSAMGTGDSNALCTAFSRFIVC
jgi:hypothetical protein